jgi:hypothetical protein
MAQASSPSCCELPFGALRDHIHEAAIVFTGIKSLNGVLSGGCTPGSPERCICNDIPEGRGPRRGIIGGKYQPRLKVPNGFR